MHLIYLLLETGLFQGLFPSPRGLQVPAQGSSLLEMLKGKAKASSSWENVCVCTRVCAYAHMHVYAALQRLAGE